MKERKGKEWKAYIKKKLPIAWSIALSIWQVLVDDSMIKCHLIDLLSRKFLKLGHLHNFQLTMEEVLQRKS